MNRSPQEVSSLYNSCNTHLKKKEKTNKKKKENAGGDNFWIVFKGPTYT